MGNITTKPVHIFFDKTECGVDFLLNSGSHEAALAYFDTSSLYQTDFFEFLFFTSGEGYIRIEDKEVEIKDNTVVFISPYQKYRININPKVSRFRFLIFQEDFLHDFLIDRYFTFSLLYCYQNDLMPVLRCTENEMTEYCLTLKDLENELKKTISDSVHILRSKLYLMLIQINRQYSNFYNIIIKETTNNFAYRYRLLLEKYIRSIHKVSDYAEMIKVSRITLNKAVMSQFGVSAGRMLKKRLLAEVKKELLNSDKSVSEIACDLHFSEPNHLMRFFKQQTGQTIGQFLNENSNR